MYPLYIASKGRAGQMRIAPLLEGLQYHLFVEPQEKDLYSAAYPRATVIDIGQNNRGLSFVRNFMLTYARDSGVSWCWIADDDILNFYLVQNARCVRSDIKTVLEKAERLFPREPHLAQVGMPMQQFAHGESKPARWNVLVDNCVCFNAPLCLQAGRYRADLALLMDREYTLQMLAAGLLTCRICTLAYEPSPLRSLTGGLHDTYDTKLKESVQAILNTWGSEFVTPVIQPYTKLLDVQINLSQFRRHRKVKPPIP